MSAAERSRERGDVPSSRSAGTGQPRPSGDAADARFTDQTFVSRSSRKGGPLTLRVHINHVSGDEGRAIGIAQGKALRRALEVLANMEESQSEER